MTQHTDFERAIHAHFRPYADERSDDGCVCTACGWIGDPADLDRRADDIIRGRVVGYVASCPQCGSEAGFDDLADHKPEGMDDAERRGMDLLELLRGTEDWAQSIISHDPAIYTRLRADLTLALALVAEQEAYYGPRPMSPAVAASHDDDVLLSTLRRGAELHDAEHDRALLRAIGGAA